MVSRASTLGVWMNGIHIGELIHQSSGALSFIYLQQWLKTIGARPISLSMPLRQEAYSGEVVFNFFDNLLPDKSFHPLE